MRVGLDFGTTNSSAAIYDGKRVRLLNLDPRNNSPTIMRSTLFITREGTPFIGREAIDRFTEANVGREIEYEWRYIGETEVTLADFGTVMQSLYAVVDANKPGRLFQSLKTHLRDRSFTGTDVFGVRYTLESLIAIVLRMVLRQIETELGAEVTGLVVGRPVNYATDPKINALAIERMRNAGDDGRPAALHLPARAHGGGVLLCRDSPRRAACAGVRLWRRHARRDGDAYRRAGQARGAGHRRRADRRRPDGSADRDGQAAAALRRRRGAWPAQAAAARRAARTPRRVAEHCRPDPAALPQDHRRGHPHQR